MSLNKKKKIIAYEITLILMSLYFALLETIIPKPFPWIKLGLANVPALIGLQRFGAKIAFEIAILRILIQSFMIGSFLNINFFISFLSGLVSILFTIFLFNFRKNLSIVAISSFSGMIHNFTQLIVVYFLLFRNIAINERGIIVFVLLFLLLGFISGLIVGVVAEKYKIKEEKNG